MTLRQEGGCARCRRSEVNSKGGRRDAIRNGEWMRLTQNSSEHAERTALHSGEEWIAAGEAENGDLEGIRYR